MTKTTKTTHCPVVSLCLAQPYFHGLAFPFTLNCVTKTELFENAFQIGVGVVYRL